MPARFRTQWTRDFLIGLLVSLALLLANCRMTTEGPRTEIEGQATAVSSRVPAVTRSPVVTPQPPVNIVSPQPLAPSPQPLAPSPQPPTPGPQPPTETGALISLRMAGQVGVLLDELPGELRERVAADVLAWPDALWLERAKRQVQLTRYRLTFRNFFYPGRGQLPLPPEQLWEIQLDAAGPVRVATQGHDLILLNYTFASTLLTDLDSPGIVEPALAAIGGRWQEPFILPFDPELLLQRTDNACVNEGGFPPHSFDSENSWQFYDHTCLADSAGPTGCHRDRLPAQSCVEALSSRVGWLETAVEFERLPWDTTLADQVRVGEVEHTGAADLAVVAGDLADYRLIYRYFEPDSCAIVEQCVGGSGWRRLLQFSATVHNLGGEALHIGTPAEDPEHNLFQYNACHDHFHFSDYGDL